jgi:PAS domain S-box-containing protein
VSSDAATGETAGLDFRAALDQVSEAVCALDGEGRFTHVNAAAEHLLGRGREELLGNLFSDALPELAASMFYTDLHRALLEREPFEAEEFFGPLGRWLVSRVWPVEGGLHVLFQDVTDLRQAEGERDSAHETLRAGEALHRGLMSLHPDGIGRFELTHLLPVEAPEEEQIDLLYADAELAECNDALARLYGFESGTEALGARLGTFLPGSDRVHLDALRGFIAGGYRLVDAELVGGGQGDGRRVVAHLLGQVEAGKLLRIWLTVRPAKT